MKRCLWISLGMLGAILLLNAFYPHVAGERHRPEAAPIRAIRAIHTAEVQFASQYGRFACSLTQLDPPAPAEENGYRFTLTCDGDRYRITAIPFAPRSRTIFSDQTTAIKFANSTQ